MSQGRLMIAFSFFARRLSSISCLQRPSAAERIQSPSPSHLHTFTPTPCSSRAAPSAPLLTSNVVALAGLIHTTCTARTLSSAHTHSTSRARPVTPSLTQALGQSRTAQCQSALESVADNRSRAPLCFPISVLTLAAPGTHHPHHHDHHHDHRLVATLRGPAYEHAVAVATARWPGGQAPRETGPLVLGQGHETTTLPSLPCRHPAPLSRHSEHHAAPAAR